MSQPSFGSPAAVAGVPEKASMKAFVGEGSFKYGCKCYWNIGKEQICKVSAGSQRTGCHYECGSTQNWHLVPVYMPRVHIVFFVFELVVIDSM